MAFSTAFPLRRVLFRLTTAWLAVLIWLPPGAHAQTPPDTDAPPAEAKRPRIGLVLSGGGARGYAHIGVLKMLERMRIPVDAIAATSMGAVVGGLYASGLRADELEQKLSQVNLSDIAFDRNERAKLRNRCAKTISNTRSACRPVTVTDRSSCRPGWCRATGCWACSRTGPRSGRTTSISRTCRSRSVPWRLIWPPARG